LRVTFDNMGDGWRCSTASSGSQCRPLDPGCAPDRYLGLPGDVERRSARTHRYHADAGVVNGIKTALVVDPVWRAATASIAEAIGCHTFRATGIAAYLSNGGAFEHAREMDAHESSRTSKLYDRTKERLTQDGVERIGL
jgi:hypothetical protein